MSFDAANYLVLCPVERRQPKLASKKRQGLEGANSVQTAGIAIVRTALQAPLRQIAENAGVDGSVVADKVLEFDRRVVRLQRPDRGSQTARAGLAPDRQTPGSTLRAQRCSRLVHSLSAVIAPACERGAPKLLLAVFDDNPRSRARYRDF